MAGAAAPLERQPGRAGRPVCVAFNDYKRFSRDVAAAHATIRELRVAGVEVQAAEQPIDWTVPEQKLLVGLYLADGEVDNDRRSAAVRRGMAARVRSGLYTFRPPVGYRATYDGRRRLGIEPAPETAAAVAAAFEMAADADRPLTEVCDALAARVGRRNALTSPSAFKLLLTCRTYVGEVPVPQASRGELGAWAPGTHVAIVPPAVWQAVQGRLDGRARTYARRKPVHPELYLRGLVRTQGGAPLTGSGVRARSGAPAVHEAVGDWLAAHAPAPGVLDLIRACVAEEMGRAGHDAAGDRERAGRDVEAATGRLARATEALVDGRIGQDAYDALAARCRAKRDDALARLSEAAPAAPDGALDAVLALAGSLPDLWAGADAEGRREIVGSTFSGGIVVSAGAKVEPSPTPLVHLLFGLGAVEMAGTHNGRPGEDGRSGLKYARQDSNL